MCALALKVSDLSFAYPAGKKVLRGVSLSVEQGAFCLLTGPTGCGKTTLLRICKPEIMPRGSMGGEVRLFGRVPSELGPGESAQMVGFVFQSPENQIVCDDVWQEMAFGLENLGVPEDLMRLRIAETCYFLGIEPWFRRKTSQLSGGQRQILALAATLVMRPRILLLDEPTSMLDPVAEKEFLALLFRANRELGTTVVVATHNPAAMRDYATQTVRLGRVEATDEQFPRAPSASPSAAELVCVRDAWFRYARADEWVLRGLGLGVLEGEVHALVGGNGCGKSTLLSIVAQTERLSRGKVRNRLARSVGMLPQNPKALLSQESVEDELMEWSTGCGYGSGEVQALLRGMGLVADDALMGSHPYDLSGGQQQLVALAKLLLAKPRLLLLDEPTKGLDARMRHTVSRALADAQRAGTTIIVATHDMGFVRRMCSRVSLLFDGQVSCTLPTEEFFASTQFFGA